MGKFKFLACSIVSDEISQKIPLISIPIFMGHYKSKAVMYCLDRIKPYIGDIVLILFDRGFYNKDLMYELSKNGYRHLIFVPKSTDKKRILKEMENGGQKVFIHDFTVNKESTKFEGKTYLSFLKKIYDTKSKKNLMTGYLRPMWKKLLSRIQLKSTRRDGELKLDTWSRMKQK